MFEEFGGNVYVGISGIDLPSESLELGSGIVLSKTYAHLMSHFMMAFSPAAPGRHHPAPWRAAQGGLSTDIQAELFVPANIGAELGSQLEIIRTIVFMMRLYADPAISAPVLSSHSFGQISNLADNQTRLVSYEVKERHFAVHIDPAYKPKMADYLNKVAAYWQTAHRLIKAHPEFALAVDSINSGQFIENTAHTLVSLWGALEALFSPATSELKFRVSALISAFMEPPGKERHALQKKIGKLYDKRSAAAHGVPKHVDDDLVETLSLVRSILFKIIAEGAVPSKTALEAYLFGVTEE